MCTRSIARHTRTHTLAARERYEPKAGVSLICLMSRYCNDFASDLRLFIYSPAVLADRTLITGASLVILTVLKSRRTQCPLPSARLRLGGREFRGRVSYGGDLSSTRSRR